MPATVHTTQ